MSGDADRAPGAHDAGPPQDRHPAEPGGRHALGERASPASSSSACATACAPTPWGRPGGWATAARSGATTRWCASSRSTSSATCRCCPASRRSAATCSRHDQVEATLMRRAGYEVRVLPEERGSWEENPPTMLEFARRDVRWCQGNMQYLKLLDLPGLYPMSRFQLVWAILMFIGIPAWTLMIALLPVAAWQARGIADFPVDARHRPLRHVLHHVPDAEDRRPARRHADARRRARATAAGCGSFRARPSSWCSRSCRARCPPSAPRSS